MTIISSTKEELNKILKDKGLKVTSTRLFVLEVFFKSHKPISAQYLCQKLDGQINGATVYRILSLFEKSDIIKKVDLRKDSVYFELNNDHHHHLVCLKCGLVEDFKENTDIEKLLKQTISRSSQFKSIKEHSLELFGYCKECN